MRLPYAGPHRKDEVAQLAAEAGLNEKAFAEALRQTDTAELAGDLAAMCRCYPSSYVSHCHPIQGPPNIL